MTYPDGGILSRIDNAVHEGSAEPEAPFLLETVGPGLLVPAGGARLGTARSDRYGIFAQVHATSGEGPLSSRLVDGVNNDALVERGTLSALVAEADRDETVGIVGVVVHDREGRVHSFGGGRVSTWTDVAIPARGPAERLDYVTGACTLVCRAVFERVGLFDEGFFFYYEDADFGLGARKGGWRPAVARDAPVTHEAGASVDRGAASRSAWADRLQVESGGRYLGKHAGVRALPMAAFRLLGIWANGTRQRQLPRVPDLASDFAGGGGRL